MTEQRRVPFPWCAPESLKSRQFSLATGNYFSVNFQEYRFLSFEFDRCLDVWDYVVGNVHIWRRTMGWFKWTRNSQ
jgi:hypothetical protein